MELKWKNREIDAEFIWEKWGRWWLLIAATSIPFGFLILFAWDNHLGVVFSLVSLYIGYFPWMISVAFED